MENNNYYSIECYIHISTQINCKYFSTDDVLGPFTNSTVVHSVD